MQGNVFLPNCSLKALAGKHLDGSQQICCLIGAVEPMPMWQTNTRLVITLGKIKVQLHSMTANYAKTL